MQLRADSWHQKIKKLSTHTETVSEGESERARCHWKKSQRLHSGCLFAEHNWISQHNDFYLGILFITTMQSPMGRHCAPCPLLKGSHFHAGNVWSQCLHLQLCQSYSENPCLSLSCSTCSSWNTVSLQTQTQQPCGMICELELEIGCHFLYNTAATVISPS